VGQTGSFFSELRRRNVFRVAVAYGIVAWLLVEVASVVLQRIVRCRLHRERGAPWFLAAADL